MSLLNTLRTAVIGITGNKLRTALTLLGVVIGVASVIAMLALGNGARAAVEESFRFLGSDSAQIAPAMTMDDGELIPAGKVLSYQDGLLMPDGVELVDRVEMAVSTSGRARHGRSIIDVTLTGTTADALDTLAGSGDLQPVDWPDGQPLSADAFIGQGRFFSVPEVLGEADVCVLGYDTWLDLFQGDDPVGESIWINRDRCLVIGVIAELETTDPSKRNSGKPNQGIYLPISTTIRQLYDEEPSVSITAHVNDESRMTDAKSQIAAYLRERHDIAEISDGVYEDDFSITTRSDILGAQQESARTLSLLLASMAVVSLVVGGIGIMNVMLVSVTERTREIGVRVAIGARRLDIVSQFLFESMLISALGGLMGIVTGVLTIPLAATLNQGNALLAPGSIPMAFSVSVVTGVLFGLYPAIRAARLDPIEALRYE